MSKITIKFDTENSEDRINFNRYVQSTDISIVLFEILNNIPRKLKNDAINDIEEYADKNEKYSNTYYNTEYDNYIEGYLKGIDDIIQEIVVLKDEHNIDIEKLVNEI